TSHTRSIPVSVTVILALYNCAMPKSTRIGVFGYGSLVSKPSVRELLGTDPPAFPATLQGWERNWTVARDNHRSEKIFALADGSVPDFIVALNILPAARKRVNGVVIEATPAQMEKFDGRELRYNWVTVTEDVQCSERFDIIYAATGKPEFTSP